MKLFAKIISFIFEPFFLLPVIVILAAVRSGMTGNSFLIFLAVLVFGFFLPPTILRYWAVKTKRITNWDISDRKQRVGAFIFLFLFLIVDYVLLLFFSNAELLKLMQFYLFSFVFFYGVTLFWKISGHLIYTVINFGILYAWYPQTLWLFFCVPLLLAWSRVVLKRHTLAQTIGGIIFGGIMYEIWQLFFLPFYFN